MLSHLKAVSFRNLEPLDWQPEPGAHLLVGGNGAGKTSVLEAIYVLATTKSFRAPALAACARHGSGFFRLEGQVSGDQRIGLEVAWSQEGGRQRAVNGKAASLAEHLSALPVVAWTAAEAEILDGPPALRRRFLDRGSVGIRPGVLEALGRYRRALSQKREILSRAASRNAPLEPWNQLLATAAAAIHTVRRRYLERLRSALAETLSAVEPGFPAIELRYRPSPGEGAEDEAGIFEALSRLESQERRRGMPLAGPHRDRLEVLWGGHSVRDVASAGERKALSLLLSAAHGQVLTALGRRPIYLLDDLDAELAPDTLARLWPAFSEADQLFATSNRPAVWRGLPVSPTRRLEGGRLEPPGALS